MELFALEPKQIQRYDANISLKDKLFKGEDWHLKVYVNKSKMPELYSTILGPVLDEKSLSKYIQKLEELIDKWNSITKQYSDFVKEELLKAIYYYIKLELCFSENNKSKLLKKIKESKFEEYTFSMLIKDDLKTIKSYTFIEPEMLEYLERTAMLCTDILDDNLIRSIIMCMDYDLIRKGSKSLLESKLSAIEISDYHDSLYNVRNKRVTHKTYSDWKRKDSVKTSFFASLLALTIGAGVFVDAKISVGIKEASVTKTYKTKIETFTSLGGYTEEEKYYPRYDTQTSILKVYSEPFESEEGLVRKVDYYQIYNFATTEELEKYYALDLSLLSPYYTETVKVTENGQSYMEIEKITQDLTESVDEVDYNGYISLSILIVILTALILLIPGISECNKLINTFREYLIDKELCKKSKEHLSNALIQAQLLLEQNGLTLNEALRRCDEIIGSDSLDELSDEYKQIIERYKEIRKTHTDLESLLKEKGLKRLLRKRK